MAASGEPRQSLLCSAKPEDLDDVEPCSTKSHGLTITRGLPKSKPSIYRHFKCYQLPNGDLDPEEAFTNIGDLLQKCKDPNFLEIFDKTEGHYTNCVHQILGQKNMPVPVELSNYKVDHRTYARLKLLMRVVRAGNGMLPMAFYKNIFVNTHSYNLLFGDIDSLTLEGKREQLHKDICEYRKKLLEPHGLVTQSGGALGAFASLFEAGKDFLNKFSGNLQDCLSAVRTYSMSAFDKFFKLSECFFAFTFQEGITFMGAAFTDIYGFLAAQVKKFISFILTTVEHYAVSVKGLAADFSAAALANAQVGSLMNGAINAVTSAKEAGVGCVGAVKGLVESCVTATTSVGSRIHLLVNFCIALAVASLLALVGYTLKTTLGLLLPTAGFRKQTILDEDSFHSQGGQDLFSYLLSCLATVFGIGTGQDLTLISKRCRSIMTILSFGGVAATATCFVAQFLPASIRAFLEHWIGLETGVSVDVVDWIDKATVLTSVSHSADIATDARYVVRIKEHVQKGLALVGKVPMEKRQVFLALWSKLLNIHSVIGGHEGAGIPRSEPYCFHLWGVPGTGKTVFANKLIRDLFEVENSDIYSRPVADTFWNGFVPAMKVILYDEFLANCRSEIGAEYLSLVSSSQFIAPLASVDSLAVGIKGTRARPVGVVSICNSAVPEANELRNKDALLRRRRFVVKVSIKAKYAEYCKVEGSGDDAVLSAIDLVKLQEEVEPEDLADHCWMEFEFCDRFDGQPQRRPTRLGTKRRPKMTYAELLAVLKKDYDLHTLISKSLTPDEGAVTASDKYFELLEEMHSVKTPVGGILAHLFSSNESESGKPEDMDLDPVAGDPFVDAAEFLEAPNPFEVVPEEDPVYENDPAVLSFQAKLRKRAALGLPLLTKFTSWLDADTMRAYMNGTLREVGQFGMHLRDSAQNLRKKLLSEKFYELASKFMVLAGIVHTLLGVYSFLSKCRKGGLGATAQSGAYKTNTPRRAAVRHQIRRGMQSEGGGFASSALVMNRPGLNHVSAYGVKDRMVILPLHFFIDRVTGQSIPEGTPLTLEFATRPSVNVSFNEKYLQAVEGADLAAYDFSYAKTVAQFRDNTKKFCGINDYGLLSQFKGHFYRDFAQPDVITGVSQEEMSYHHGPRNFTLRDCFKYQFRTACGDCGTMIEAAGGPMVGKLVGMHVGGDGRSYAPTGVCNFISRELIERLTADPPADFPEPGDLHAQSAGEILVPEMTGANLESIRDAEAGERQHVGVKTKLRPSILYDIMNERYGEDEKTPPILDKRDPRAKGEDPLMLNIRRTGAFVKPVIPEKEIDEVAEALFLDRKRKLKPYISINRMLTLDEAVAGLPGYYSGVDLTTSLGFPLCSTQHAKSKPGKKAFVLLVDGVKTPTPLLRKHVADLIASIHNGTLEKHYYVAYLKDELMSKNKIDEVRTRIIYCGDFVMNLVLRMAFGGLMSGWLATQGKDSITLSINQYSHDMQVIKETLDDIPGEGYLAGDYKDFDKRTLAQAQRAGYDILGRLGKEFIKDIDMKIVDVLYEHQARGAVIARDKVVQFGAVHHSGCFWTTIGNSLNNEIMIRLAVKRIVPRAEFNNVLRMVSHGDDIIMRVHYDYADRVHNLSIAAELSKLGQIYTNDIKDQPLTSEFRKFEDITYLGAHPVLVDGRYSGAAKKDMITRVPRWTRGKNVDMLQVCYSMMDKASQWDRDFYEKLQKTFVDGFALHGLDFIERGYLEVRRLQAGRTVISGEDFGTWTSQSSEAPGISACVQRPKRIVPFGVGKQSKITTFTAPTGVESSGVESTSHQFGSMSINEGAHDLHFATDSDVYRQSVEWNVTHSSAVVLGSFTAPFELLAVGNQDTVQNIEFNKWLYWHGDVKLTVQINGTQFQQGLAVLYWRPLKFAPLVTVSNIFTLEHVKITPDSKTYTLTVPFRHPRGVLNTYNQTDAGELGTFFIQVISPLRSGGTDNHVTMSVFSSFPNSNFTIPRPIGSAFGRKLFQSQGPGSNISSVVNTWGYDFNDSVVGNIPIENVNKPESKGDPSLSLSIPMDNPPLASGGLPVYQQFSAMSKSNGLEPTVALQLHPGAMSRPMVDSFGPHEEVMRFDRLVAKEAIYAKYNWALADIPGTLLFSSKLTLPAVSHLGSFSATTIQSYIADLFQFWRANFIFDFYAVKTNFHSGKLRVVIGYGVFEVPSYAQASAYMNVIMDFSKENHKCSVEVPYNAQTPFLKTWDGSRRVDPIQNCTLGYMAVYVQNQLIAPESVPNLVEVVQTIRLSDPHFAVPRPVGLVGYQRSNKISTAPAPMDEPAAFHSQSGGVEQAIIATEAATEDEPTETVVITDKKSVALEKRPCRLDIGMPFEYVPATFPEIMRRGTFLPPGLVEGTWTVNTVEEESYNATPFTCFNVNIPVRPRGLYTRLFGGWRGSMRFRMFMGRLIPEIANVSATFMPLVGKADYAPSGTDYFLASPCLKPGSQQIYNGKLYESSKDNHLQMPIEMFKRDSVQAYIDVMVPFQTIFQFLPHTTPLDETEVFTQVGSLTLMVEAVGTITREEIVREIQIYSFWGDDFALGCYTASDFFYTPIVGAPAITTEKPFGLVGAGVNF